MRAEPEPEPKREKLSLRMELKRKRQGGEVPSGQDDNSAPSSVAVGKYLLLHLSTSDIHSVFGFLLRNCSSNCRQCMSSTHICFTCSVQKNLLRTNEGTSLAAFIPPRNGMESSSDLS
jgi:hypothetical protein